MKIVWLWMSLSRVEAMTRKQAEGQIYLEMALSLQSDLQDKGSWIYIPRLCSVRTEDEIEALVDAATRIMNDYFGFAGRI